MSLSEWAIMRARLFLSVLVPFVSFLPVSDMLTKRGRREREGTSLERQ
jgi:hypothetical protein